MSKLLELLQGTQKQNGGIFPPPVPDMEITFTSKNGYSVIVESTTQHEYQTVMDFVQNSKGGKWMFGAWSNGDWQKSNPYQNSHGLWTWLLTKDL